MHTILDLEYKYETLTPPEKKMLQCFRHDFVVMLSHVYSDMAVQLSDLVICTTASRNVVYMKSHHQNFTISYIDLITRKIRLLQPLKDCHTIRVQNLQYCKLFHCVKFP